MKALLLTTTFLLLSACATQQPAKDFDAMEADCTRYMSENAKPGFNARDQRKLFTNCMIDKGAYSNDSN